MDLTPSINDHQILHGVIVRMVYCHFGEVRESS